jgi:hypothetical protein
MVSTVMTKPPHSVGECGVSILLDLWICQDALIHMVLTCEQTAMEQEHAPLKLVPYYSPSLRASGDSGMGGAAHLVGERAEPRMSR